jgi:O-methyltransferase involved in polyketide biosynthesis
MDNGAPAAQQKPVSAARMSDYFLGGIHNFPADRAAAQKVIEQFPFIPVAARANRAFLGRAVRYLVGLGFRQFLDLGSGLPTAENVHEIAQRIAPESRVAYVDIEPVVVAESLEILEGNERAIAVRGDVRDMPAILAHPQVRRLLDFQQPTVVLMVALLQFVTEDAEAHAALQHLVPVLQPGSYVVFTHAAAETFATATESSMNAVGDVYRSQTPVLAKLRTRAEVTEIFTSHGLELIEPGVVWTPQWRPELGGPPPELPDRPEASASWAGIAKVVRSG